MTVHNRLSNRDARRVADDTADLLSRLCSEMHHGVLQRIEEARIGIPAARYDRTGGPGTGVPDPTAAWAMRANADVAQQQRYELERELIRARRAIDRCLQIAQLYPEAHTANDADRLALERLNARPIPGCESCARVDGPRGGQRWEPPHPKIVAPTDVGGRLPKPMWLCRWCWERVGQWDRLPSVHELEAHHDGKKVAWPHDIPRPETTR